MDCQTVNSFKNRLDKYWCSQWFDWSHQRHHRPYLAVLLVRSRSAWAINYSLVHSLHLRIIWIQLISHNTRGCRWTTLFLV